MGGCVAQREQNSIDRKVGKLFSVTEGYLEGKLDIVVNVSLGAGNPDYQLIISGVPPRWQPQTVNLMANDGVRLKAGDEAIYSEGGLVFVWSHGITEASQEIIPTLISGSGWVRLERFKRRLNFMVDNVVGFGFQPTSEVVRVRCYREIDEAGIDAAGISDGATEGLVKGVTDIVDGITGDGSHPIWYRADEFDLVRFQTCYRIDINDVGVAISRKERGTRGLENLDIFLSLAE